MKKNKNPNVYKPFFTFIKNPPHSSLIIVYQGLIEIIASLIYILTLGHICWMVQLYIMNDKIFETKKEK